MSEVAILAPSFFDLSGANVCMGGGERYLVDLVDTLRQCGHNVAVYQASNAKFDAKYKDITVHGLGHSRSIFHRDGKLSQAFNKATAGIDRAVYFRMDLGWPEPKGMSIGISHGIWWDYPGVTGDYYRTSEGIKFLLSSVDQLTRVVANDTNMANWFRCMKPGSDLKFYFVPNYVDLTKFIPEFVAHDTLNILFPRRLCVPRGVDIMIEATKYIVKDIPNARVLFVGSAGNGSGENKWTRQIDALGRKVSRKSLDMSEMPSVYHDADICVIPTKGAEGTSLSCLEAMASSVPVIASVVGGLSNLIIDQHNGLLIKPTPDDIVKAVKTLVRDPKLAASLAESAHDVAIVHSLKNWRARWSNVIKEVF